MRDFLKKVTLAGIGITVIGKEKVEALAEELIKKGELKKEDADDLIEKTLEKSDEIKKALEDKISSVIKCNFKKLNIAQYEKVEKLEEKIKALEKRLNNLEAK